MALYWDCKNVKNFKKKNSNEKLRNILENLIYGSLSIGMRVLTEDNIDEWIYRLNRIIFDNYRWNGYEGNKKYKPAEFFKDKDIRPWIGLRTNVVTISSRDFDDMMRKKYESHKKMTVAQLDANPKDWKDRYLEEDKK